MRRAAVFFMFLLVPLLLGTTYVVRENGKDVGEWSENDGKKDTRYVEYNNKIEPVKKIVTENSSGDAEKMQKILPQAEREPLQGLSMLQAMKAVPWLQVTTTIQDEYGSYSQYSSGSGAFINATGVLITNYHVVKNATKITVIMYDENYKGDMPPKEYSARVLRVYPYHDLAIVSANVSSPNYFRFAAPETIKVGDEVKAIGNPQGLQVSISKGIVSAIRTNKLSGQKYKEIPGESIAEKRFENIAWIQTDAAINPGNSGGPLLNLKNELVGINTFILEESEGLGFASHVKHAIEFAEAYQR